MTTTLVEAAEQFSLKAFRGHGAPGAKFGTIVQHQWDEELGIDGYLHQVTVLPKDDDTVRVLVSVGGFEHRLDDLDIFRKALVPAVREHVLAWFATQVRPPLGA